MASLLAIDWDQRQLHLVAVRTQRKGMQVEWAADWDIGADLAASSAEAVGKRLRDFLKLQQVTATSVVVSIGREKVILKEVRFPAVSVGEEPGLVRFQATKDLTEPPDAIEVDYTQRTGGTTAGERQALAVLTRKDLLAAIRALCRGAGLKLLGVAPRPFGAPYALERTLQAGGAAVPADILQGVLTVGERWAELCLFRGHELILARSLPAGSVLVGEVRRSLAVHAAQNAGDARLAGPEVLYVFGNGNSPTAALAEALPCRVEAVSPLTIADAIAPAAEHQGPLAGAVGLAQRWAVVGSLPVNLAMPKKVQAAVRPGRRRWLMYGAAVAVLLLAGVASMSYTLAGRRGEIQKLMREKNRLDDDIRLYAQDRADIDALKEWDQAAIPWLDELYDLTVRFPYEKGFRINHFAVEGGGTKKGAKDVPTARVRITGVAPSSREGDALVQQLRDTISRDPHLKATIESIKGGTTHEFTIRIDVAKQPPSKYESVLVVPIEPARAGPSVKTAGGREGVGR